MFTLIFKSQNLNIVILVLVQVAGPKTNQFNNYIKKSAGCGWCLVAILTAAFANIISLVSNRKGRQCGNDISKN